MNRDEWRCRTCGVMATGERGRLPLWWISVGQSLGPDCPQKTIGVFDSIACAADFIAQCTQDIAA